MKKPREESTAGSTATPTSTATSTATPTATSTATSTATPTATSTPTPTATSTPTPTATSTPTPTSTSTSTSTSTATSDSTPRALLLWTVLAVLSLVAYVWVNMDLLGDTFWYIATGRYVLAHHAFPQDELFSYSGVRGPWFVNMPISEPLFAWITDHWGVWILLALSTVVFVASLTLFWLPHAKGGIARILTWPLVVLAIYVERVDLSARGQTIADVFIAILFICMFRIRDGKKVPIWLPLVLGAFWVNIHPSFLLGVLVPFGYAIALRIGPAIDRPALRPLFLFTGLEALGGLVNPYGYKLIGEFFRFTGAESTTAIDLFVSPDFKLPEILLALFFGVALIFFCLRGSTRNAGVAEAILMLALVTATCVSRRYVTILVFFEIVVAGRLLSREPRAATVPPMKWIAALCVLPLALTGYALVQPKDPWLNMPVEAADFIDQNGLPDNVLNILHWGGYLDYRWGGQRKVFIDGRTTQFENGVLTDHGKLVNLTADSREVLDIYLINTVLWERGSPLDQALSRDPEWSLVYKKGIAVVYVRNKPKR